MAFNLADVLKNVPNSGTGEEQLERIPLELIDGDPNNFYQLSDIPALADNISLCGLQQPIRVRQKEDGRYVIVSGHRRRAALEMLVADGYERFREASCIVEQDTASPALQQLRLIYANCNTRSMTAWEISQQAEQVKNLLYKLKEEEGYEFPGRMRDHVAEAVGVSKSKLARLKVIQDNLAFCWQGFWKDGTIGETVAYNLSQLPKSWQGIIYNVWGEKPGKLYADIPSRAKESFAKVSKIQCQHGLSSCEHAVTMMEKNSKDQYYAPCSGCCFECSSLQTCKNVCPQAQAKQKEMKAVAKQAEKQSKQKEKERARPYVEFARMVWDRQGQARRRSGVSVEALIKASGMSYYNASVDDSRQERMENGQGDYSRVSTLGFGCSLRTCDVMRIVSVADALQCSVDYLLGRTDVMDVATDPASVPNSGTLWQTGNPAKAGRYLVRLSFGKYFNDQFEERGWDGEDWYDDGVIHDPEYDGDILGWIPLPADIQPEEHAAAQSSRMGSPLNHSCVTGMSPSGHCGAAACCDNEHTCCLQCDDPCNSRCGWIDDVAEEI